MRRNLQAVGLTVIAAVLLVYSSGLGFTLRHCLHSGTTRTELAWLAEAPPCQHAHESEAQHAQVPSCCRRAQVPECCANAASGVCPAVAEGQTHKPCCEFEFRLFQLDDYAQLSVDGFNPLAFSALVAVFLPQVPVEWPHPLCCAAQGAPPEPAPPLAVGRGALVRHQVFRL